MECPAQVLGLSSEQCNVGCSPASRVSFVTELRHVTHFRTYENR